MVTARNALRWRQRCSDARPPGAAAATHRSPPSPGPTVLVPRRPRAAARSCAVAERRAAAPARRRRRIISSRRPRPSPPPRPRRSSLRASGTCSASGPADTDGQRNGHHTITSTPTPPTGTAALPQQRTARRNRHKARAMMTLAMSSNTSSGSRSPSMGTQMRVYLARTASMHSWYFSSRCSTSCIATGENRTHSPADRVPSRDNTPGVRKGAAGAGRKRRPARLLAVLRAVDAALGGLRRRREEIRVVRLPSRRVHPAAADARGKHVRGHLEVEEDVRLDAGEGEGGDLRRGEREAVEDPPLLLRVGEREALADDRRHRLRGLRGAGRVSNSRATERPRQREQDQRASA